VASVQQLANIGRQPNVLAEHVKKTVDYSFSSGFWSRNTFLSAFAALGE